MGRKKTILRRTFLIGSVAIAGGVAFGAYVARKPYANPIADGLAEGEASFNPWVKISADQITLITPHADLGQGAAHMQALLIAEEMDIDLDQFETEFGNPDPAYFNTAMADEGVPFMSRDDSGMADTMRAAVGYVIKMFGFQGTGGSTSVADSFDKLRMAGAVARETLKRAASEQTGIDVAELKTARAAVILPDDTEIAYTDLAAIAAGLEPVTDVALRDPSEWRLIGKEQTRIDISAKSTGLARYGIDLEMEGMVYASVRFNPRQGGAMKSFDASEAEGMRGVTKLSLIHI